jgi:hypothetical protein
MDALSEESAPVFFDAVMNTALKKSEVMTLASWCPSLFDNSLKF